MSNRRNPSSWTWVDSMPDHGVAESMTATPTVSEGGMRAKGNRAFGQPRVFLKGARDIGLRGRSKTSGGVPTLEQMNALRALGAKRFQEDYVPFDGSLRTAANASSVAG